MEPCSSSVIIPEVYPGHLKCPAVYASPRPGDQCDGVLLKHSGPSSEVEVR